MFNRGRFLIPRFRFPLVHLHEAGGLHLLPLIGEIFVSPLVFTEAKRSGATAWLGPLPDWLKPQSLSASAHQHSLSWQQAGLLHGGEAEALALAIELKADWFLTDDAAARLLAESLGLEVHGSLGVVLWAAATRQVGKEEAESLLAGLERSSLWMSPRVRDEARTALAKLFPSG